MKLRFILSIIVFFPVLFSPFTLSQNAIIVVLDGARYSETFGSDSAYIKYIWTKLKPAGTIFTNYRNNGITSTITGHSSIETGIWQTIDNHGINRPTTPTIFEYFRKWKGKNRSKTCVVAGKEKLKVLTHSNHPNYGKKYRSMFSFAKGDPAVLDSVLYNMDRYHPRLMVVNFADIDAAGHDGNWNAYLNTISHADSLVYILWQKIQSTPFYRDRTTLFVTNDHGRHDNAHGGFKDHGDGCEGCRHIMLLMAGRNIPAGVVDTLSAEQIDVAPTVGELLHFPTPYASGKSLLKGRISHQNKN
jgi:hypothetical protein